MVALDRSFIEEIRASPSKMIQGYRTPYGVVSCAALHEMRLWVMDCDWQDADSISDLPDVEIIRGVHRHYSGGIEGFLRSL